MSRKWCCVAGAALISGCEIAGRARCCGVVSSIAVARCAAPCVTYSGCAQKLIVLQITHAVATSVFAAGRGAYLYR